MSNSNKEDDARVKEVLGDSVGWDLYSHNLQFNPPFTFIEEGADFKIRNNFSCELGTTVGLAYVNISAHSLILHSCIIASQGQIVFSNIKSVDCKNSYIKAPSILFNHSSVDAQDFGRCVLIGEIDETV